MVRKNINLYKMTSKFRKLPLTCLIISIFRLLIGKLRLSKQFIGKTVEMNKNSHYQIFRHITNTQVDSDYKSTVFIVSFKFSKLSHKANKLTSIIPMLLITGFPGFVKKIYAVNHKNGYWQGMYQWESIENLEEYKNSIVFKVMNKRAIPESINSVQYENRSLDSYIFQKLRE
jgi:hypothetical protein